MTFLRDFWFARALAAGLAMVCGQPARADELYPSRMITLVVPITAGTTIDILARIYAEPLSKKLGQQVIVSNRPGAGGIVAAQVLLSSPADGYTLLVANSGHAVLGAIKNLTFNPVEDFAAISTVGDAATVVTVSADLGITSLRDLVALAKAKPGTLNYGSAGVGTATHLAGAYFAKQTGIDLVHVPYTNSSNILADLVGGRIQASFSPVAFTMPYLLDGRMIGLAVSSAQPMTEPVAIPTAASQGVDYRLSGWYGMLALKKTPQPILEKLAAAIAEVGKDPEVQQKIRAQGIEPLTITLEAFDKRIRDDLARLEPVLQTMAKSN